MTARAALLLLLLSATALCGEAEDKSNECIQMPVNVLQAMLRQITENHVKRPVENIRNKVTDVVERLGGVTGTLQNIQTEQTSLKSKLKDNHKDVKADMSFIVRHLYNITQLQHSFESRLNEFESLLELTMERVQNPQSRSNLGQTHQKPVRDCSDLPHYAPSSIYQVKLRNDREPVRAYCEQDTDKGAWTVIQRRADIKPRQDFFLGWEAYKQGFGELDKEFWWGLEHLFQLTSQSDRTYELLVDMEDLDGKKKYARYASFSILSEANLYRLKLGRYSGDAGDSLKYHNNQPFSTMDADHDSFQHSCAKRYKGGWWYNNCHNANLNGMYLSGAHKTYGDGVNWNDWRGYYYSLKNVEMKIRPT